MWSIKLLPLLYNLRLASWLLILGSAILVTFSTMIHFARKYLRTHPESRVSKALSLDFYVMDVITRLRGVGLVFGALFIFCAGYATGWHFQKMQQYNHTAGAQIHVLHVVGPYRYLVEESKRGRYEFDVCQNIGDPGFDEGDFIDVLYEEQGQCKSLADPFGFRAVPGHAKGREIKFEGKP